MSLSRTLAPATNHSAARFARSVERRNLKQALSALQRSTKYLQRAEGVLQPWLPRLQSSTRGRVSTKLQDAAKSAGAQLHRARMTLLTGPERSMGPLLEVVDRTETLLLSFGNGVCLGGLFSSQIGPRLRKAEAAGLLQEALAALGRCNETADAISKDARRRLLDLEMSRATKPSRKQRQRSAEPVTEKISDFLLQVKHRGWKVAETQREEASNVPDALATSHAEVNRISGSHTSLLPDDSPLGLCCFPIVLVRETKLSDTVRKALTSHKLELLTVYGSYVAINGLYLMGIHRDLMMVSDLEIQPRIKGQAATPNPCKKYSDAVDGKRLDIAKFTALLPVLLEANTALAEPLRHTVPIGTPVKAGKHYYLPLLPRFLTSLSSFSLGEWQPLLSKTSTT